MKIIKETCYKGTRILLGNEKQEYLQRCRKVLKFLDFIEIQIPIIQFTENFKGKVGEENNNMMYPVIDRGNRDLCLAPEYTAIIQKLAKTTFKNQKDVKLFYVAECFRGEKPQKGRYRQFTQLGVEVLNYTSSANLMLYGIAENLISIITKNYELNLDAVRGLDYYDGGVGFEITCDELGSSKQICGGGKYDGGVGFAVGVDRLLELLV